MNSWNDIRTDLDARFHKDQSGAKVHTGFRNAYQQVADRVKFAVDGLDNYSLYVTGHSLGGALAVIAAKELERDSLAACYTFGSPRVGDEEFGEKIRAPIYRIINAADGVPRIPPNRLHPGIISVVSFFKPQWGKWLKNNFCGYLHQGDMRYLTACDDLSQIRVIPNLNLSIRRRRLTGRMRLKGVKVTGADHKVNGYREKLKAYAEKRNPTNSPR